MLRRLQPTSVAAALALLAAFVVVRSSAHPARVNRASEEPAVSSSTASAPVTPSTENLSAAVCPVVYQLDDSPGNRGYHYIFYGNAFFINRDGYLLTAAHVLSEFHNGGQPSVLVRLTSAPPRLLKTEVIAVDPEHDVAILRATPNPFAGPHSPYDVIALSLGAAKPSIGEGVEATALRPEHLKDPHFRTTYRGHVSRYRAELSFNCPESPSRNQHSINLHAVERPSLAVNASGSSP